MGERHWRANNATTEETDNNINNSQPQPSPPPLHRKENAKITTKRSIVRAPLPYDKSSRDVEMEKHIKKLNELSKTAATKKRTPNPRNKLSSVVRKVAKLSWFSRSKSEPKEKERPKVSSRRRNMSVSGRNLERVRQQFHSDQKKKEGYAERERIRQKRNTQSKLEKRKTLMKTGNLPMQAGNEMEDHSDLKLKGVTSDYIQEQNDFEIEKKLIREKHQERTKKRLEKRRSLRKETIHNA